MPSGLSPLGDITLQGTLAVGDARLEYITAGDKITTIRMTVNGTSENVTGRMDPANVIVTGPTVN